jgi:hypothetical protein
VSSFVTASPCKLPRSRPPPDRHPPNLRIALHHVAYGSIFEATTSADLTHCCSAECQAHAEADHITTRPPALDERLDVLLHLSRHSHGTQGWIGAGDRSIQDDHQAVPLEACQCPFVPCDDCTEHGVVFIENGYYLFRFCLVRKGCEATQVAEDDGNLRALSLKHSALASSLDEFSELRGKEALQPVDTLGALLGDGKLLGHVVEVSRKALQFIAGRDRDPMIKLAGADPLSTFFEHSDRTRHAPGKPVGECGRECRACE